MLKTETLKGDGGEEVGGFEDFEVALGGGEDTR